VSIRLNGRSDLFAMMLYDITVAEEELIGACKFTGSDHSLDTDCQVHSLQVDYDCAWA